MENEDIYDLAEVKYSGGTDLEVYVDIELLFGLDIKQTKEFLKNDKKRKELSNQILEIIQYYEALPNTKFKNRTEYINYFETKKINRIKFDLETIV